MKDKDIKISSMALEDIDEVLIIENLCFTLPWVYDSFYNEIHHNKFAFYHTISSDNKIIGYSGLWQVLDEGHITNIAIHPDYRRSGFASSLLQNLLDFAVEHGICALTLEVRKSNDAAQKLYQKFGFIVEGMRKGYYADNKEDALIMWNKNIQQMRGKI